MRAFSVFFTRAALGALLCAAMTMLGMAAITSVFVAVGWLSHFAFSEELTIGAILGTCAGAVIWGRCVKPRRALIGTALFYGLPYLIPFIIKFQQRFVVTPTTGEIVSLVALLLLVAALGAATGLFTAKILPIFQSRMVWLD